MANWVCKTVDMPVLGQVSKRMALSIFQHLAFSFLFSGNKQTIFLQNKDALKEIISQTD